MAIIYTYPTVIPEATDILLGTEKNATLRNPTKNFQLSEVAKFIIDSVTGTSLDIPLFFDVTDTVTGLTQTTLVDSIIAQDANPGGTMITITGNISVTGSYTDSAGNTGTANQVLTSTGAGGTAWATDTQGDKTFVFTQAVAANPWVITHNLNKYPSVTVTDNSPTPRMVFTVVDYTSINQVTVTFTGAQAGKAYLN